MSTEDLSVTLHLLSREQLEQWLSQGDRFWLSTPYVYCGEVIDEKLTDVLRRKIRSMEAHPGREKWYSYFAIIYGGRVVGLIGPKGPDAVNRSVEIGYGVGVRYRNKGLATAAVVAFCRKYFTEEGLYRITARTAIDNLASQRVLQKAGFVRVSAVHGEVVWASTPSLAGPSRSTCSPGNEA